MKKIAIVGHGFVGQAVEFGFNTPDVEFKLIDPKYGTTITDDLIGWNPDVVFVCVPTPTSSEGAADNSIILSTMMDLMYCLFQPLIIIKSTISPSLGVLFAETFGVVINPEFLTENSAKEQFVNPNMHVFGGEPAATQAAEELYTNYSNCKMDNVFHVTGEEACYIKYSINSFLATKVTFFNQLYNTVDSAAHSKYNNIIKAIACDPRIGRGHTFVPGYDGKKGFGGACLPKDIRAFYHAHPEFSLLNTIDQLNNETRSQYDLDDREKVNKIKFNRNGDTNVDNGQTEKE